MSTRHLRNIDISQFESFLELALCRYIGIKNGHAKYFRADLGRPIIFQTHIDPIPEFIVKNALRTLEISKKDFWEILEGQKVVKRKNGNFTVEKKP